MMRIGSRSVGSGAPCLVIAEAGVNHNGDAAMAHRLIDAAAAAGADAVKFQTFDPDALVTLDAQKAAYQERATGHGTQHDMLRALVLPPAVHRELSAHARDCGLIFASTPFDLGSLRLLLDLGVSFIKVGSGDLTNLPLLRTVAAANVPVVMSTGMATLDEVASATEAVTSRGASVALLHCVSQYPARPEDTNLAAMRTLREQFGCAVGLSDHSPGTEVSLAAVALGASVIEKHLTLDKALPGPDHAASLDAREFMELVRQIRNVEVAIGDGIKQPRESEAELRTVARRALYLSRALAEGDVVDATALVCLRPATGIGAQHLDAVVGRRVNRSLESGARLEWEHLR
jgi:N,N'-diacetyllegionaminate synthase